MTLDSTFVSVLDYLGVFVFALSGAWLAIRRDLDLVGVVTLGLATGLAGCSLADDGSDSPSAVEPSPDLALESRVLAVVCDNDRPDTQEQLVQLARYARERDGRSDRIWEVADNPDCPQTS